MIKIKDRLPECVRVICRDLYDRYAIDRQIIRDLMEYFNLSYRETIYMLKLGSRLNSDLWKTLNPKSEEDIRKFYEISPFYVFDLVYWHARIRQNEFRKEVIKIAKGDVLDYGGGIGDLCVELVKKGYNVTYADMYGKTFDFAKWLFERRKVPLEMINLSKDDLTKKYDTIICIDVIEHVQDQKDLLKKFCKHLKTGGYLIIMHLESSGFQEDYPMHFKIDFDAEGLLNSLGLIKSKKEWLWVKNDNNA